MASGAGARGAAKARAGGGAMRRGGATSGAPGARLPRNKKPTRDELLDAMELEGLTTPARLAHKWGRSAQAARGWLQGYALSTDELVKKALEERRAARESEAAELLREPVEGELVDEETHLPALPVVSSGLVQASAQAEPTQRQPEPEDLSAFDRLSARQQKAALVISSFGTNLTSVEVARRADVHADTVAEWRRDATFQEAVLDLQQPLFRFEASLLVRQKLLELVATGKARPEDRRLLAEMAGLVGGQGSVNVSFTKVVSFKG